MSLLERVQSDVSAAMKAGDRERAAALRVVASELQKAHKEAGGGEADEIAVLQRERKRRVEAADAYREAGRDDLVAAEEREAELIDVYLPEQLSDQELGAIVGRELSDLVRQGHEIAPGTIEAMTDALDHHESPSAILEDVVWRNRGKAIAPKTVNQKRYVDAIRSQTITVGIGPAGTGKSFLAVAMAVAALQRREVNRIVLTRPAVEAGERLGFLPGDLMAKVDPYLRPLFDALYDMLEPERGNQHLERGAIEIAPLAFMRGRTLNDSFIILDEAQNTSPEQMKMFLTRLGFNSKMVVTGDITQIDLDKDQRSGLVVIGDILSEVEGIEFVRFGGEDVVRHKLVQRIVNAYNEYSERRGR